VMVVSGTVLYLHPPKLLLGYIFLPLFVLFGVFLASIILFTACMAADTLAEIFVGKIISNPDPSRWTHQVVYLICTLPCYCLSFFFFSMIRFP
jgi:hypothetical protein